MNRVLYRTRSFILKNDMFFITRECTRGPCSEERYFVSDRECSSDRFCTSRYLQSCSLFLLRQMSLILMGFSVRFLKCGMRTSCGIKVPYRLIQGSGLAVPLEVLMGCSMEVVTPRLLQMRGSSTSIIMKQYLPPLAYSVVFLSSVYIDKALRHTHSLSKLTSRLLAVTCTTLICMLHCMHADCADISSLQCFYLEPMTVWPILKTLIANTILFSTHIASTGWELKHKPDLKSLIAAPILEELLFRATFFRSSHEHVSLFYLALVFGISHSHKLLYKMIRGKPYQIGPYIGQMLFTFVFSLYCLYILKQTHEVLAVMALHAYCNLLGPPYITQANFKWHLLSVLLFLAFLIYMF